MKKWLYCAIQNRRREWFTGTTELVYNTKVEKQHKWPGCQRTFKRAISMCFILRPTIKKYTFPTGSGLNTTGAGRAKMKHLASPQPEKHRHNQSFIEKIYIPHRNTSPLPTDDDILKMVFRLGVLKLDMQTVLDADLHLNYNVRKCDQRMFMEKRIPGVFGVGFKRLDQFAMWFLKEIGMTYPVTVCLMLQFGPKKDHISASIMTGYFSDMREEP